MAMAESDSRFHKVTKVFILAGEASGDAYGGTLVRALRDINPDIEIRCWGGEQMESAGATVLRHYRSLAFMGIWEVIKNLRTIRKRWKECLHELESFQPDAFVGIDYPGFNLRIARHAHKTGIQTHHYISPSVWAWKKNRIHAISRDVDHLHVILPFEAEWYAKEGMKVNWVGHPLIELLEMQKAQKSEDELAPGLIMNPSQLPILLLLPGSRKQELERMLPMMIQSTQELPHFFPVIAGAPGRTNEDYSEAIQAEIPVIFDRTRDLMNSADVALVTSGTATLEAALLGLPHVICYRTSGITYRLARWWVESQWIGLPNILLQRTAVPECIQHDCTGSLLAEQIKQLHSERGLTTQGEEQKQAFVELRGKLKVKDSPSELVARAILQSC